VRRNMSKSSNSWSIENIPAFCITLDRRPDRWKRFQDQSGIQGISVKRFSGVDGKTIDLDKDDRIATLTKRNIKTKTRRSHEELDSIGGVGCSLSHIAIWQWMVDHGQELCLVFEDDAVIPLNFKENANQCIQKSVVLRNPKQWDMWLLGGIWDDLTRIPDEPIESNLVRIGSFMLSHGYVITLPTAKQFLKNVYPIHSHIDAWMSIYAYLTDMRLVGSTDLILHQQPQTKSDIQSDDGCAICNVPAGFEKTQRLVSHVEWRVAQASEVICVALIAYMIYRHFKN
jgi:GR25 family glycosyltransferase involved in LPS biosynthesis